MVVAVPSTTATVARGEPSPKSNSTSPSVTGVPSTWVTLAVRVVGPEPVTTSRSVEVSAKFVSVPRATTCVEVRVRPAAFAEQYTASVALARASIDMVLSRLLRLAGPAPVPAPRRPVTRVAPAVSGAVTSKAICGKRHCLCRSTCRPAREVNGPQLSFSLPPLLTEWPPSQMRANSPLASGAPEALTRWTTGLLLNPVPAPEMRRLEIATPSGSLTSYFMRPVSLSPVAIWPGWSFTVKVSPGWTCCGYSTVMLSGDSVR